MLESCSEHLRRYGMNTSTNLFQPRFCCSPQQRGRKIRYAALSIFFALSSSSPALAAQNSDDSGAGAVFLVLLLLFIGLACFVIYFLPTIIAFSRAHPNRWPVFLINLFFGSTGIGWLGALIWSLHKVHDPVSGRSAGGESGLNIFANDAKIVELKTPPELPKSAGPSPNIADLERLASLFERGLLSEPEYKQQKERLLRDLQA